MEDSSKVQPGQDSDEELAAEYANNVFFAPTVWDLKIIFGELSGTKQRIDWHTSVTCPWAIAKLIEYYLALQIAGHEQENGPIRVPRVMWPPDPPTPSESEQGNPD